MRIDEKEAAELRDKLHNLDINNTHDYKVYYKELYYITASGEGFKSEVYRDTKGSLTIGYGFNMDRGDASRNEWNDIFDGRISFDEAKKGNVAITREQGLMLKRYGVTKRENELAKIYAPYWRNMRLNERAVITDMYYQLPALVGRNTRISKAIKKYYRTNEVIYLDIAVKEIEEHSSYSKNPVERIGLQNRNNIRAIIFDSRNCPLYSRPQDELIPVDKVLEVIPGETVISRDISENFSESNKLGDYYIWRTCMDDNVRPSHQVLEGKVFKHEDNIKHPGEDYKCRCRKQKLPIHARIIEEDNDFSGDDSGLEYDIEEAKLRAINYMYIVHKGLEMEYL